jgi:hypothetical protein
MFNGCGIGCKATSLNELDRILKANEAIHVYAMGAMHYALCYCIPTASEDALSNRSMEMLLNFLEATFLIISATGILHKNVPILQ